MSNSPSTQDPSVPETPSPVSSGDEFRLSNNEDEDSEEETDDEESDDDDYNDDAFEDEDIDEENDGADMDIADELLNTTSNQLPDHFVQESHPLSILFYFFIGLYTGDGLHRTSSPGFIGFSFRSTFFPYLYSLLLRCGVPRPHLRFDARQRTISQRYNAGALGSKMLEDHLTWYACYTLATSTVATQEMWLEEKVNVAWDACLYATPWTFKRKTHLFGHLRIVHDVEPPHEYECDRTDCMEDFVSSRALYYHQRDAHPEIPCGCCSMSFVSVDKLNKHATSYHKNAGPYNCSRDGCSESYEILYDLTLHQTNDHQPILCCDKTFINNFHYKKHVVATHRIPCEREDCNETFTTDRIMKEHLRKDHEKIPCTHAPTCQEEFTSLSMRQRHLESKNVHGETIPCDREDCNETFRTTDSLNYHQRNYHEKIPCTHAPTCQEDFTSFIRLERHLNTKHDPNKTVFYCDAADCHESFTNETHLNRHKSAKHPQRRQMPRRH